MSVVASPALLVRSVAYGESDLIATFFTEEQGKVSAIVRGARRSTKRFGGALEPIHELYITYEDKGRELCALKEARIERARMTIVGDLDAMDAAGHALRWVRHLCPARTPEPSAWRSLAALLDALEGGEKAFARELAFFGLHLLGDVGYGLELARCVRCGRVCPEGRPAFIDATGGGLVCTSCGGARRTLKADVRALALRAMQGQKPPLTRDQANEIITVVEEAMAAHADFDPSSGTR
jgi:DNA repair protein RecO (recombination protein O)